MAPRLNVMTFVVVFTALAALSCCIVTLGLYTQPIILFPLRNVSSGGLRGWEDVLCAPSINNVLNMSISEVDYLVIVHTAPGNTDARNAIRETWAEDLKSVYRSQLFFLLGKTSNRLQAAIEREHRRYSDIIQGDFVDAYDNATLKSVAMLKMVLERCPNLRFLLKVNDDSYLNVRTLVQKMVEMRVDAVHGFEHENVMPTRDKKNARMYVSYDEYSGSLYPNYANGSGYVIGGEAIDRLYRATLNVSYLRIEDVYVTGLCREHAHVKLVFDSDFDIQPISESPLSKRLIAPKLSAKSMRQYWRTMRDKTTLMLWFE